MINFHKLFEFKDRFSEFVIAGSGPSNFNYDFSKITLPIIFINDMHRFSENCPSEHQYFITHHILNFQKVKPLTIHIERMYYDMGDYSGFLEVAANPIGPYISVECQATEEAANSRFFGKQSWLLDKKQVALKNRLAACYGSATTALHFAWFAGAQRVTMIGCNPDTPPVHDARIGGKLVSAPELVQESLAVMPNILGLEVVHV